MEPRAYEIWATRPGGYRYLGGTPEYDLWFDDDDDLRIVPMAYPFDWGYMHVLCGTDILGMTAHHPDEEHWNEIVQYLTIFAPDVMEAMRKHEEKQD